MPKYFFCFRNDDYASQHSDGIDFPDFAAVQLEAIKSTGEMLRDLGHPFELDTEWRMEVVDETSKPVFILRVIAESLGGRDRSR